MLPCAWAIMSTLFILDVINSKGFPTTSWVHSPFISFAQMQTQCLICKPEAWFFYSEGWYAGPKHDSRPASWFTRAITASQICLVLTRPLFLHAWHMKLAPLLGQHPRKVHMHSVRWEVTCWNFLTALSVLPSEHMSLIISDISEWSEPKTSGIAAAFWKEKCIDIYAVVWPLKSIVLAHKWKQSHSL